MPAQFRDYYETLGVSKTASADEIKSAVRKLARKHHPDLAKDKKAAEEKFKEIKNYTDILDSETESFNVLPVLTKEEKVSDYFLVFRMRSVHLLYAKNGSEIPLV